MNEKFASNGDVQVQYLVLNEAKAGIPVIFIPGAMVSAEDVYDELKEHIDFYCVIISTRGLGKSSTPESGFSKEHLVSDIESVIAAEKINNCFLLGHSFGASIASAYAVKHPGDVKGLILGDYPPYYPAYSAQWGENLIQNRPELNAVLIKGLLNESKKEKFTDELAKCGFNILILKGESEDSLIPIEFAEKINAAMPNSTLQIIPNSGHEIFGENPGSCLEAVREFIGNN